MHNFFHTRLYRSYYQLRYDRSLKAMEHLAPQSTELDALHRLRHQKVLQVQAAGMTGKTRLLALLALHRLDHGQSCLFVSDDSHKAITYLNQVWASRVTARSGNELSVSSEWLYAIQGQPCSRSELRLQTTNHCEQSTPMKLPEDLSVSIVEGSRTLSSIRLMQWQRFTTDLLGADPLLAMDDFDVGLLECPDLDERLANLPQHIQVIKASQSRSSVIRLE